MTDLAYASMALIELDAKLNNKRAEAEAVADGRAFLKWISIYVSSRLDKLCEMSFAPRIETRWIDVAPDTVSPELDQLRLPLPFLSITTVKVDGTTLTAWDYDSDTRDDSDYYPYPRGTTPIYVLQGLNEGETWLPGDESHYLQGIEVTGISGYRQNYQQEGWKLSGDTVQTVGGINATATEITISDVAGKQYDGGVPRFSENQLIRMGTEFSIIRAIQQDGKLEVERGVRGSTAAIQAQATPIYIWYPEPEIVRACQRWGGLLYNNRAVYETFRVSGGAAGDFTSQRPQDMPEEVQNIAAMFMNPNSEWMSI